MLEVSATSSSGDLSTLGLLTPVVCVHLLVLCLIFSCIRGDCGWSAKRTLSDGGTWVTAGRASVLLDVEGATTWIAR